MPSFDLNVNKIDEELKRELKKKPERFSKDIEKLSTLEEEDIERKASKLRVKDSGYRPEEYKPSSGLMKAVKKIGTGKLASEKKKRDIEYAPTTSKPKSPDLTKGAAKLERDKPQVGTIQKAKKDYDYAMKRANANPTEVNVRRAREAYNKLKKSMGRR